MKGAWGRQIETAIKDHNYLFEARIFLDKCPVWRTLCSVYCMPPESNNLSENKFENLRLELRRGCLILAVLGILRAEHYGYTLRKVLAERGLIVDEGTLYPLLRRLESQGLLVSHWREEERRNKRFYRLSAEGEVMLARLLAEWQEINRSLTEILGVAEVGVPV